MKAVVVRFVWSLNAKILRSNLLHNAVRSCEEKSQRTSGLDGRPFVAFHVHQDHLTRTILPTRKVIGMCTALDVATSVAWESIMTRCTAKKSAWIRCKLCKNSGVGSTASWACDCMLNTSALW